MWAEGCHIVSSTSSFMEVSLFNESHMWGLGGLGPEGVERACVPNAVRGRGGRGGWVRWPPLEVVLAAWATGSVAAGWGGRSRASEAAVGRGCLELM